MRVLTTMRDAATALVWELPLIHENARDFEAVRKAVAGHPERLPGLGDLVLIRSTSLDLNVK